MFTDVYARLAENSPLLSWKSGVNAGKDIINNLNNSYQNQIENSLKGDLLRSRLEAQNIANQYSSQILPKKVMAAAAAIKLAKARQDSLDNKNKYYSKYPTAYFGS